MPREIEGSLQGRGLRIAVVASRFNQDVTDRLLRGALDALTAHGVADDDVTVVWVPGSFEVPTVARRLAASSGMLPVMRVDAVGEIALAVTPYRPMSLATTLVNPAMPSLAAP